MQSDNSTSIDGCTTYFRVVSTNKSSNKKVCNVKNKLSFLIQSQKTKYSNIAGLLFLLDTFLADETCKYHITVSRGVSLHTSNIQINWQDPFTTLINQMAKYSHIADFITNFSK